MASDPHGFGAFFMADGEDLTMMKFLAGSIAALSVAVVLTARAEDAAPVFNRERATGIVREFQKIVSPRGIDERLKITVGDSQQWISVRGRDSRNPIILFIHGGPASPEMQTSWAWQGDWEDYFTVVQWDQRGAGKSYLANDPETIGPTLSLKRISDDAAEVVQYLRRRYAKEKIFVLGHSWGSVVGITLARAHPELLYAYIGMGQVISGPENERVGYQLTLRLAEAQKNTAAINELKSIAPYPAADGSLTIDQIMLDRKWNVLFGGLTYGRKGLDYFSDLAELSPDYTAADVAAVDKGEALSFPHLLPDLLTFNFSNVTQFECPIFMFEGRYDSTTPSQITADWFKRVQAPKKGFVWFENSAHMIEVEEPGRVLVHLVEDVRPLAGKIPN
jgi:pimeloyl-ACP methyl ester carboxylesterase